MTEPFRLLGVAPNADDAEIKKAYLAKVREFPPERFPERFQEIRAAFETLQNRKARLAYQMFHTGAPDLPNLWPEMFDSCVPGRLDEERLRKLFTETLEHDSLVARRTP